MATPEREPAEHRDPFENLRLDEGFVRAAQFIEPSAADRGRPSDRRDPGRCQVVPANRRLPGMHRMVWAPGPSRRRRRFARAVAFVAVVAGIISIAVALRNTSAARSPVATASAAGTAQRTQGSTPLAAQAAGTQVSSALLEKLSPGDCVTWNLRPGSTGPMIVSCTTPHLAEVTRKVGLAGRIPGDDWPGPETLDSLAGTLCADAYVSYASHARPDVKSVSSALEPDHDAWNSGARQLVCTAQRPGLATIGGTLGSLDAPA
jgi:hypothetical protein